MSAHRKIFSAFISSGAGLHMPPHTHTHACTSPAAGKQAGWEAHMQQQEQQRDARQTGSAACGVAFHTSCGWVHVALCILHTLVSSWLQCLSHCWQFLACQITR